LGEAQVKRVHNVLDEEPVENAYHKIKDTLLSTRTLTLFQFYDKIVNMDLLGSRKPTELLAEMAKCRPKDDYHFFTYKIFLQRLPHVSPSGCSTDIQALAEKAGSLMALH
jgi:hypothetical protein